ncbi:MAG: aminopeptidase P family protein [SAR324 cluster bacterium]|nr:aminopeptidase P family protein [SAR324 cluster bacterium]
MNKDVYDLPFSVEEYRGRVKKVQAEMERRNLDFLLIHTPTNNYYLSGLRTIGTYSYMMLMVPREGDPIHFNRWIEETILQGTSWVPNVEFHKDTEHYLDATVRVLGERGMDSGRIGIEKNAWYLTIKDFEALKERLPNVEWVDSSMLVDSLRLIKSPAEQEYSRRAGQLASDAMRATLDAIKEGATEGDLMATAYSTMYRGGCDYPSLPPLINSGVRHSMAHGSGEGNAVKKEEAVHLEIGVSMKRYHAATLRAAFLGNPPKHFMELTDLCNRALEAGLTLMRPGTPAEQVDHAVRKVIDDAGYGHKFRHKAGYSIGVGFPPDWSEAGAMMLRGGESRPLEPGMIFHILPAIFEYREYGVGMSETVLITENGHEVLTNVERKLFVL